MKRFGLVVVAVAVLGGLGWMLFGRSAPPSTTTTEGAAEDELDRDALLDRKRRARGSGQLDRSPARALGRVTEAGTDTPIRGAIVLLTPKGLDGVLHATEAGRAASPLRVRTDDDGQWTLEGLVPGRYTLSATGRGYLPATRSDVALRAGQDNGGLHLTLVRGGHEVRGTVFDIGGGPVEDVLVRATRLDNGSPFNFDRPGLGAVTDEEGTFSIQLADGLYQLRTYHPDYVEVQAPLHVDGGPRSVDLRITPAGSIEGRVLVRETGTPLAGATVTRSSEQAVAFFMSGVGEGPPVVTDDDGRFTLRGLGSGAVRLVATAPGYASRQPVEVVLGVAEQLDDVELLVDPARTVSGFVVARGHEEQGLEGVLLGAFSVEPPRLFVAAAPSAADGYFEVFGVMPGTYTVAAVGEQALPNFLGATVEVEDVDVDDVLVIMDRGVHVRGRITPAVPARISVQVDASAVSIGTMMDTLSNALVHGRTAPDGTFDLHPVADGTVTVVAEADDGSRGELRIDVRGADVDGLSIPLLPRASVGGRVIEASGEPGRGLDVTVRAVHRGPDPTVAFTVGGVVGHHVATTDETGAFIVRGLDAGDYEVSVSAGRGQIMQWARPSDPAAPKAPLRVSLAASEARTDLELWVEARNGLITGTVVAADGQPVADAWVTAMRQDVIDDMAAIARARQRQEGLDIDVDPSLVDSGPRLEQWGAVGLGEPPVLTDEAGHFEVPSLRAGLYRVRAEAHKDGSRGFVEDVPAGSDVRIDVRGLAGIDGRVHAGGQPVPEYSVVVQGPMRRQLQVYDPKGTFSMRRLDAGTYAITVRSGVGTATAEVDLTEGQTLELPLPIRGWATLRGRVIDAGTGDPLEGLSVTVVGATGPDARAIMGVFAGDSPTTDAEGRFEIGEVVPGEGTLMIVDRDASGVGGVVAQQTYVVEAEEQLDLGTITGIAPSYVDPADRGTVGLAVRVATYARRPRAPTAPDDDERAAFDKTQRLWVTRVTPQGPAARQGLVPGDELIAVDDTRVRTMGAMNAATLLSPRYLKVGETLSLEIEHGGERRTITLAVEPR